MTKKLCLLIVLFTSSLMYGEDFTHCEAASPDKTVLVAILARNKAHTLPTYLHCLEKFDYDKKLISIYINTNNNHDSTQKILKTWAKQQKGNYARIIFEDHQVENLPEVAPHAWPNARMSTLAGIREKSMRLTKELGCDYYFVADCDTFLAPCTLRELVKKELPIVAPMIKCIPERDDIHSSFFANMSNNGLGTMDDPTYHLIFNREMLGTLRVPLVHIAYLVRADVIDKLSYVRRDDNYAHEWEFQTFARSAREHCVDQFICNEKEFGTTLYFSNMGEITYEEESAIVGELVEKGLDQHFNNYAQFRASST